MKQALLTSVITLVGAIVLFAISEFARGLFIGPILNLRAHIGDVVDKVIFYSADLTSGSKITPEREKQIREQLRALATQLRAKEQMLPIYRLWAFIRLVPVMKDIDIISKQLVGLSNSFEWQTDAYPPKYYCADYVNNTQTIRVLQNALKLKGQIVPEL